MSPLRARSVDRRRRHKPWTARSFEQRCPVPRRDVGPAPAFHILQLLADLATVVLTSGVEAAPACSAVVGDDACWVDGVAEAAIAILGRMQTSCRLRYPAHHEIALPIGEASYCAGESGEESILTRAERQFGQHASLEVGRPMRIDVDSTGVRLVRRQHRDERCTDAGDD